MLSKKELVSFIQDYQRVLLNNKKIGLSAAVSDCSIVFAGQLAPHLKIHFINYPKFPLEAHLLKATITDFTKALMEKFEQKRVIIEYLDEPVMFELTHEINPRIH